MVNTHAHYDHCFGNAAFRPAPVWGSRGCAADLAATGEQQRAAVVAGAARARADRRTADLVTAAPIDPPDHLVDDVAVLDVGGREVALRFLGRGHTDHDLVVEVETTGDDTVVFAGDLVEEGAPPAFEDAYPAEWPATLGRLHALARGPVVPGHGAVVDAAFVGAQREELLAVLTALRAGRLAGRPLRRGPPMTDRAASAASGPGEAADDRQRQDPEQPGDRAPRPPGHVARAPARARLPSVSASTPLSRSTVNGPRRPTLMSVAM